MKKSSNIHDLNRRLDPAVLTIFGATGDLTADYLMPALLHMHAEGMLPKDFKLVCVGRKAFTTKQYFSFIVQKSAVIKKHQKSLAAGFLKRLVYFQGGDFGDAESFRALAGLLADHGTGKSHCRNRLYYFATAPEFFGQIAETLKRTGLLDSCKNHGRSVRVVIEKPFGSDTASAQKLNRLLLEYFSEDQLYRIDHYQGKETVQNLMVARFANSIFEPLWNGTFVDHIEISVLEKDTAENRIAYYDQTGALKDMVQNHVLQMLSLITMDRPEQLTAQHIRDEKLKILKSLRPFDSKDAWMVRGQYRGYTKQAGRHSDTETFVALKVCLDTPRWRGVPVYLRTGKGLSKKLAEVSVHFKEPDRCIFRYCAPNIVTFRIQPDEQVQLRLNNKVPGFGIDLHQTDLDFSYRQAFVQEIPTAYERLLLDVLEGDQRLFVRSDEIEAAWKFIDSAAAVLPLLPMTGYGRGSDGPKEAENAMRQEGRVWWTF